MAKTFNLSIVSPENIVFDGKVNSMVLPSELGYMGILPDHAPMVANLAEGDIIIKEDSGNISSFKSKKTGILQILNNKVTVLL